MVLVIFGDSRTSSRLKKLIPRSKCKISFFEDQSLQSKNVISKSSKNKTSVPHIFGVKLSNRPNLTYWKIHFWYKFSDSTSKKSKCQFQGQMSENMIQKIQTTHNLPPCFNFILTRKSISGSTLIQSLIQKNVPPIKIKTSVLHIFDVVLTAFLVVF